MNHVDAEERRLILGRRGMASRVYIKPYAKDNESRVMGLSPELLDQ